MISGENDIDPIVQPEIQKELPKNTNSYSTSVDMCSKILSYL